MGEPLCVISLLQDTAAAKERLLERGREEGAREDDSDADTIKRRVVADQQPLEEVEKHYIIKGLMEKGDLHAYNQVIYASRSVEEVGADVEAAIAERVK